MKKNDVINVRVSKELKKKSTKIFDNLGISTSQAIEMYLRAVVRKNGIPFKLRLPNDKLLQAMYEADNDINMTECEDNEDMWKKLES